MDKEKKHRVVILGSGFAGFRLAREIDYRYFDVTLVSPKNFFLFTPLLASTTVGTIEFRSIIEPVRTRNPKLHYFQATALDIDTNTNTVRCAHPNTGEEFSVEYDTLAIGVGVQTNTFGVAGVDKHCLFLKTLADARKIRQQLMSCLELASIPTIPEEERKRLLQVVIVGGGPTGVECAAEIHDFVVQDLKHYYPEIVKDLKITVIEATNSILSSFDEALSSYTAKQFRSRNIELLTGATVERIRAGEAVLSNQSVIPFGLAIWTAGIGPLPFIKQLPFAKDSKGRLRTDKYLQLVEHDNIYGLGDCAAIDDVPLSSTAQVAEQQGKHLAKHLMRLIKGKEAKPFSYFHKGMLAYVGGGKALADGPVKMSGFLTWIAWRSIYLTKLVSLKNRILVLFDWIKTTIFGRDTSKF